MRILRLAQMFERKYPLLVRAADVPAPAAVIAAIRKDLANSYHVWLDPENPKSKADDMLFWSNLGFDPAKMIVKIMKDLSDSSKEYTPAQIFHRVNSFFDFKAAFDSGIGGFIDQVKDELHKRKGLNRKIDNELKVRRSKADTILRHLSHNLEKQGDMLKAFLPEGEALRGGYEDQERLPLTAAQWLEFFKYDPLSLKVGFSNLSIDVIQRLLEDNEMREKLTTIRNASKRGHDPRDLGEALAAADQIKKWLERMKRTNVPALEQEIEVPENPSLFYQGPPSEKDTAPLGVFQGPNPPLKG